ncbi:helix-turn-helix domain-containing protein [Actinoplanes sp. CA-054009]
MRSTAVAADPLSTLTATELSVYVALDPGPKTVAELGTTLRLTAPNIRKALRSLRAQGLVHQEGGQGRPTTYRRASAGAPR